ncbi:MAG TPA: DUF4105 domain-containing protein [Paludibacter sp.]|nr:DUF4105 domain-containing protein [Paludibacter sp.]
MKKTFLSIFAILFLTNSFAQPFSISDSAIVSLITCSPGKEVYAKFGHTAIRVKDAQNGIDLVFNYGIFNFDTDGFYYKFMKGETDYQLGVYETNYFLPEYAARNSMVWEQPLNMTPDERKSLIRMLEENYKPENRVYRYNFIFDNCSTRPRDKIVEAMRGRVRFSATAESKTFRQWVAQYVGNDTWLKFGIDLIFGLEADRMATGSESMFLPEVLMGEIQDATVVTPKSTYRLVSNEKKILVDKLPENEEESYWFFKPAFFSILLLIVGVLITIYDVYRKRIYKPFDSALLALTGIGGCIAFYLMVFSVHPLVKMNLNLLWLNPLNLALAVLVWFRSFREVLFYYQIVNMLLLVCALFAFSYSAQVFNIASFPLIVLLLLRATNWFAIMKRRIFRRRD